VSAIINQPWEDVADDVTGAIEKAVQPLLKKATDAIYAGLLDTTQDYLRDNLAFNIASRIDGAERQAYSDRIALEVEKVKSADLLALVIQYRNDLLYPPSGESRDRRLAAIRAALAKALGDAS
jgi:hypothetical protein